MASLQARIEARIGARIALAPLLAASIASAGCFGNFDERLYMAAERDGGRDADALDASRDAGALDGDSHLDANLDAAAGPDAGLDGGTDAGPDRGADAGSDAGVPPLALADYCAGETVPTIPRPAAPTDAVSTAFLVDTRALGNDFTDVAACTGVPEPGPDGVASVMMLAGERWHFHVRRPTAGANAAIYVLSTCDERTCPARGGQDLCMASGDEHFSFTAPTDGLYYVVIDSEDVGYTAELDVIHPVCGDHVIQHSENCDDGNTVDGDRCDSHCRAELASGATEIEANDDIDSANHLILGPTGASVVGRIASACESDVFAFDVPAGETAAVTLGFALTTGACPADASTPIVVSIFDGNNTTLAEAAVPAAGGCPMLGGGAIAALGPGQYYARVRSISGALDRPIDYRLTLGTTFVP